MNKYHVTGAKRKGRGFLFDHFIQSPQVKVVNTHVHVREVAHEISLYKNCALDTPSNDVKRVHDAYSDFCTLHSYMDFDDILVRYEQLLGSVIQSTYTHILVDECQDFTPLQFRIIEKLSEQADVFLIGDPEQSIYGFRGARGTFFSGLYKNNAKIFTHFKLVKNYRTSHILATATSYLRKDRMQQIGMSAHNNKLQIVHTHNCYTQAHWICERIRAQSTGLYTGEYRDTYQYSLADFAILARSNYELAQIQTKLDELGIPYQNSGDEHFLSSIAGQLLASCVRYLTNFHSNSLEDIAF